MTKQNEEPTWHKDAIAGIPPALWRNRPKTPETRRRISEGMKRANEERRKSHTQEIEIVAEAFREATRLYDASVFDIGKTTDPGFKAARASAVLLAKKQLEVAEEILARTTGKAGPREAQADPLTRMGQYLLRGFVRVGVNIRPRVEEEAARLRADGQADLADALMAALADMEAAPKGKGITTKSSADAPPEALDIQYDGNPRMTETMQPAAIPTASEPETYHIELPPPRQDPIPTDAPETFHAPLFKVPDNGRDEGETYRAPMFNVGPEEAAE